MVDTSGSMESDNSQPMYNAIGLGIRIAEMSKMGKRVLTFHSNPTWVNLENKDKFTGYDYCYLMDRQNIHFLINQTIFHTLFHSSI